LKKEKRCKQRECIIYSTNNNRIFLKSIPIKMPEASRTANRPDQRRTNTWNIIIKTTSIEIRQRILKAVREKTNNIQR
jgi:hypothetical protein